MAVVNVVKHDAYDTGKLNALYQIVSDAHESGNGQDYEILVDEMRVVPRTSNPELFNSFVNFILADSQTVAVKMFRRGSNQHDKYFFHIKGVPQKPGALNGIPENMSPEEWQTKEREKMLKEIRYEELEEENKELRAELVESEKRNDKLMAEFLQLKEGKLLTIGEMGSALVMRLIANPKVQETFPLLNGLAGVDTKQTAEAQPEETATFKRKGQMQEEAPAEISEEDQAYLILIRDLQERLTNHQLQSVMHILNMITQCPKAIGPTMKAINNFLSSYEEPQTNGNEKV